MIPFINLSYQQLMWLFFINQISAAIVQSLEPPTSDSGAGYKFFYKLSNLLIADFKTFAQKIPTNPTGPATPAAK